MAAIDVRCDGSRDDGWVCSVTLREGDLEVSSHRVRVSAANLDRLAPGSGDPRRLVEASFAFLLERESPQMILRSFDLSEIGRYFPEYEREIRRRMRRRPDGARPRAYHRGRVRALRRPIRRAVPDRRALAVHRAARALRDGRLRLGRRLADGRRGRSRPTATSGPSPTIPARRASAPTRRRASSSTSAGRPSSRRSSSRTPSRSTIRPAASPSATTATSSRLADARGRYRAQGRIHGRADTEVGARWLEDVWDDCPSAAAALRELHRTFPGKSNLATLARDGSVAHYAGNEENPVFSFRLGRIGVVSTALYSIDRSLFQLAATGAEERRLVRPGVAVELAPDGSAAAA